MNHKWKVNVWANLNPGLDYTPSTTLGTQTTRGMGMEWWQEFEEIFHELYRVILEW